jgi:hypothetical protein
MIYQRPPLMVKLSPVVRTWAGYLLHVYHDFNFGIGIKQYFSCRWTCLTEGVCLSLYENSSWKGYYCQGGARYRDSTKQSWTGCTQILELTPPNFTVCTIWDQLVANIISWFDTKPAARKVSMYAKPRPLFLMGFLLVL